MLVAYAFQDGDGNEKESEAFASAAEDSSRLGSRLRSRIMRCAASGSRCMIPMSKRRASHSAPTWSA